MRNITAFILIFLMMLIHKWTFAQIDRSCELYYLALNNINDHYWNCDSIYKGTVNPITGEDHRQRVYFPSTGRMYIAKKLLPFTTGDLKWFSKEVRQDFKARGISQPVMESFGCNYEINAVPVIVFTAFDSLTSVEEKLNHQIDIGVKKNINIIPAVIQFSQVIYYRNCALLYCKYSSGIESYYDSFLTFVFEKQGANWKLVKRTFGTL